jgi:hypothetical protein
MMRRVLQFGLGFALLSLLVVVGHPQKAHAEGLQIRPLLYQEKLSPAESKKGYVDVSNASHTPVKIQLKVSGFRQTDSKGNLEFFDSEIASTAIKLDLTEVDLGPSEAVRVYFLIDGRKLPAGDNFAAIFAATKDATTTGAAPSAQVGTLLVLENGAGGSHSATVKKLAAPLLSFSDTLQATAEVQNTAAAKSSNAFFPNMTISLGPWPSASRQSRGPLVFAGITREVPVSIGTGNRLGFFKVSVATQDGKQERWLLLVTGIWRWILIIIIIGGVMLWRLPYRIRFKRKRPAQAAEAAQSEEYVNHRDVHDVPGDMTLTGDKAAPTQIPARRESVTEPNVSQTAATTLVKKSKTIARKGRGKSSKTKVKSTTKKAKKH